MLVKERMYEGEYITIPKNHALNQRAREVDWELRCIGSYPHHHLFLDEELGYRVSISNVDLMFLGYVKPAACYNLQPVIDAEKQKLIKEMKEKTKRD